MARSLVYADIRVYRLVMSLLYGGGYRRRFQRIIDLIGPEVCSVCDLCFGDTVIAEWCRSRRIRWVGVDLNHRFCERARNHGFDAREGDLFAMELPSASVFVMAGSLYHFHTRLTELFDLILGRTSRLILSEPVRNVSSRRGLLGWWARRAANAGSGRAAFRYEEATLLEALREQQQRKHFVFRVVSIDRDMLLEITH
jgi:hypothetical protein